MTSTITTLVIVTVTSVDEGLVLGFVKDLGFWDGFVNIICINMCWPASFYWKRISKAGACLWSKARDWLCCYLATTPTSSSPLPVQGPMIEKKVSKVRLSATVKRQGLKSPLSIVRKAQSSRKFRSCSDSKARGSSNRALSMAKLHRNTGSSIPSMLAANKSNRPSVKLSEAKIHDSAFPSLPTNSCLSSEKHSSSPHHGCQNLDSLSPNVPMAEVAIKKEKSADVCPNLGLPSVNLLV
eukprot:CAMPEP_0184501264 /NCGR_PEP_ID=MMETSP0113_2-20130426/47147_1 /TAXON_ID=91329 /ORGANISM="Norrisiella sphaerica, Strain BC52" /LENGTH=238 /DNA_ID=CAMNT_0026889969 /DNA_START=318 /DNA_END=1035 /DNA_ORIENTATION=+